MTETKNTRMVQNAGVDFENENSEAIEHNAMPMKEEIGKPWPPLTGKIVNASPIRSCNSQAILSCTVTLFCVLVIRMTI